MGREENKKRKSCSEPCDMRADSDINTDPDGMWTGVSTEDPYEKPIQDADDL